MSLKQKHTQSKGFLLQSKDLYYCTNPNYHMSLKHLLLLLFFVSPFDSHSCKHLAEAGEVYTSMLAIDLGTSHTRRHCETFKETTLPPLALLRGAIYHGLLQARECWKAARKTAHFRPRISESKETSAAIDSLQTVPHLLDLHLDPLPDTDELDLDTLDLDTELCKKVLLTFELEREYKVAYDAFKASLIKFQGHIHEVETKALGLFTFLESVIDINDETKSLLRSKTTQLVLYFQHYKLQSKYSQST